jgi:hypothetical protein
MFKVFFSYSHEDETYRDQLEKHLAVLKRNGIITTWHDRRIVGGEDFSQEINKNLEKADLILLLISPDFLASDYCYEVEMQRAIHRHQEQKTVILPVILQYCDWQSTPFGKLLAVPKDGKPILKYPNIDEAFLEVVNEIKKIAGRTKSEHNGKSLPPVEEVIAREVIISKSYIRSGNLRIKKEFTDQEKDTFQAESFEYIANFFENSLQELDSRNQNVGTNFKRMDANRFTSIVYINGKEASRCNIFFGERGSFSSGILYSYGKFLTGSHNESLTVEDDGYTIYLRTLGMSMMGTRQDKKLTMEGAAEYYWDLFIGNLQ